jgi:hypothetical protein
MCAQLINFFGVILEISYPENIFTKKTIQREPKLKINTNSTTTTAAYFIPFP